MRESLQKAFDGFNTPDNRKTLAAFFLFSSNPALKIAGGTYLVSSTLSGWLQKGEAGPQVPDQWKSDDFAHIENTPIRS